MKWKVEFESDKFPSYGSEVEGVNWDAGIWGKRLAEYLAERLPAHGVKIATTYAEDWGWCLEIDHDGGFLHFVGCVNDSEDKTSTRYICFIEPNRPSVRKWFKKIDTTAAVAKVAAALDRILGADPDIRSVTWTDE
jgi:hypothetical protein